MLKTSRLFLSTAFRQHSEINAAAPNVLLKLSSEESLFAKRLGFSVDDSSFSCNPTDGSIVSPHFIIQTLTHKTYRDGRAFFETLPAAKYVETLKDPAKISIKDLLVQNQGNISMQKCISFLDIPATKTGIAKVVAEETIYASIGAILLRKGAQQARAFLSTFA
ncbi:hypothetical protein MDAP_002083 [Mitosporidium daphniae]|uniref:Uncharacterized protein n=1 Tax=Mitosporidium daphniae TaxID=1485682 RepID=A0A098VUZ6_9MICR|nr:uncharacterized protein DI09_138p40 [Mitosporidium daphniae]KGG52760.1 hypothetical protein DI09_138p40 [Mitosporidium daphniae]|eukprot:XP_013239196.1 uncharacterized protein DI09_138p40 [Mitosporidium daphniae]